MPRSAQPPITSSIALGRPSSTKKSAGPPMPNDVREASGSSSLTPGSEASHLALDAVRQLIAQLVDVARAHQEQEVARAHEALEHLSRRLEVVHERGQARVAMRLEDDDEPAMPKLTGGLDRGPDLGGVVRVIVVDR